MYDPYIRFHARHRPHATAVSSLQGDVTYRRFDQDIDRVAFTLAEADLGGAKLAAVSVGDAYAHWLILLALARLGVGTATVLGPATDEAMAVLAPEIWITDHADAADDAYGARVLRATPDRVAATLQRDPAAPPSPTCSPEALARVTLSSGTTGTPKKIARSWRGLSELVTSTSLGSFAADVGAGYPMSRFLCMVGPDTIAFSFLLSTWLLGGTVVLAAKTDLAGSDALRRLSPTTLLATPVQLQDVIERLPSDSVTMPNLAIIAAGSRLPPTLGRALRLRVTANLWNWYGSTEASVVVRGQVSRLGDDGAASGWVEPGAEVQAVDEQDQPLPPGVSGFIRLRAPALVSGYLDDEEATARHFKDGWFYPGDVGSLSADGLLRIEGRTDEVMNFGGVKFACRMLEEPVLACAGVRDVAAFDMPDAAGLSSPWLAVVRGDGLVQDDIAQALKLPALPPVHIAWIDEIPRNERGKVQRNRLRAAAQGLNL